MVLPASRAARETCLPQISQRYGKHKVQGGLRICSEVHDDAHVESPPGCLPAETLGSSVRVLILDCLAVLAGH